MKIPTATDLPRRVPRGTGPALMESGPSIGAQVYSMGTQMEGLAQKQREVETRRETAAAEADFLIYKAHQDQEIGTSKDYTNMAPTYHGNMTEELGRQAAKIQDPEVRALFVEKHRVTIAEGQQRVQSLAWEAEKNQKLAETNEKLDQLSMVAETVPAEELPRYVQSANALLEADPRIIDPVTAGDIRRKFVDGVLINRVKARLESDPSGALQIVNSDFAKQHLHPSQLAEMRARIDDRFQAIAAEGRSQRAQDRVSGYLENNVDRVSAINDARKIRDEKEREAVLDEIDAEYSRNEAAKRAVQRDTFESEYNRVSEGGRPDAAVLRAMSPEEQNAIRSLHKNLSAGVEIKGFNGSVDNILSSKWRNGDYDGILTFIQGNADKISTEQYKYWRPIGLERKPFERAGKGGSHASADDAVSKFFPPGTDEEVVYRAKKTLWEENNARDANNKPPLTSTESQHLLEDMVRAQYGGSSVLELNEEEVGEVIMHLKDKYPEIVEEVIAARKQQGRAAGTEGMDISTRALITSVNNRLVYNANLARAIEEARMAAEAEQRARDAGVLQSVMRQRATGASKYLFGVSKQDELSVQKAREEEKAREAAAYPSAKLRSAEGFLP